MNCENDMIVIESTFFGNVSIPLSKINLSWPPPEFLVMDEDTIREATKDDPKNILLHRTRMSLLTDEQAVKCPGVARGAEYKYMEGIKGD